MSRAYDPPPPEVVAELRAWMDRPLSREEFEARVNAPMDEFEREQIHGLIDWFMRRYPTPWERLAYARRAAANLKKMMPPNK